MRPPHGCPTSILGWVKSLQPCSAARAHRLRPPGALQFAPPPPAPPPPLSLCPSLLSQALHPTPGAPAAVALHNMAGEEREGGSGKKPLARSVESLGWLASSGVQPRKRREIEGARAGRPCCLFSSVAAVVSPPTLQQDHTLCGAAVRSCGQYRELALALHCPPPQAWAPPAWWRCRRRWRGTSRRRRWSRRGSWTRRSCGPGGWAGRRVQGRGLGLQAHAAAAGVPCAAVSRALVVAQPHPAHPPAC